MNRREVLCASMLVAVSALPTSILTPIAVAENAKKPDIKVVWNRIGPHWFGKEIHEFEAEYGYKVAEVFGGGIDSLTITIDGTAYGAVNWFDIDNLESMIEGHKRMILSIQRQLRYKGVPEGVIKEAIILAEAKLDDFYLE